MQDLFSKLFEVAKTEGTLIAIYTDTDAVSRFAAGYIQEYDETMVYLQSISPEGNDDGCEYIKVEDIFQVEYNSRYLRRLQLLLRHKPDLTTYPCVAERQHGENYLISMLKQAMADHLFISIKSIYDYSVQGYITAIDDVFIQFHEITVDGDDDGITVLRIEDIERVLITGRKQKKVEFYYNNRSLLSEKA